MIIKLGSIKPAQIAPPVPIVAESAVEPKEPVVEEAPKEVVEPVPTKQPIAPVVNKSVNIEESPKENANERSESTVNSNLLSNPETIRPQEAAKQSYELPEPVNKMINNMISQYNTQNEAQKKQYEQLANTLNESITAKNNAEQECTNRLNTVVDIIEKTFSEGTFDKIVESNTKMVEALTSKHNEEIGSLRSRFATIDQEVMDLTQEVGSLRSRFASIDNKDDSIYELEDRIQELEDANQDLVSENKSLNLKLTQMQSIIKHHEDLLNKCINVLNNAVDESLMKQFFPEIAQTS